MLARRFPLFLLLALLTALPAAAAEPEGPQNLTYDVWVSSSFTDAPFTPFHDCAQFSSSQMCLAACGDCGPLTILGSVGPSGVVTVWQAAVPCGGLNLVFLGTSFDGSSFGFQANVLGGSGGGRLESSTFGIEGVENSSCVLSEAMRENPYQTPRHQD